MKDKWYHIFVVLFLMLFMLVVAVVVTPYEWVNKWRGKDGDNRYVQKEF